MGNVIKKKDTQPITNREKIQNDLPYLSKRLELILDTESEIELFCTAQQCFFPALPCDECDKNFLNKPYEPPHRMWSTAVNNTVDYKQN